MIEAAASVMMLAVAMTLVVKVVGGVAREHRANDRRSLAMTEAANLMERAGAIPFDDLTPAALKSVGLSDQARASLPGASLDLGMTEDDPVGGKGSKRISLKIRWRNLADDWEAPVSLTTWTYRRAPR